MGTNSGLSGLSHHLDQPTPKRQHRPVSPSLKRSGPAMAVTPSCHARLTNYEKEHQMFNIGDKPGIGRYCCTTCGWSATLDDNSDVLPPCGNCGAGQQTQYQSC